MEKRNTRWNICMFFFLLHAESGMKSRFKPNHHDGDCIESIKISLFTGCSIFDWKEDRS